MPIDPKDALSILPYNLEEFESVDDFREKFEGDFLSRANAHTDKEVNGKILGKTFGAMRVAVNGLARDLGIDAKVGDDEDPREGLKKIGAAFGEQIKALKEAKNTAEPGEEVKKLQQQIDQLTKSKQDLEGLVKDATDKYTNLDKQVKEEKTVAQMNAIYSRAYSKIPFKEGMSKHERSGFEADVRANFLVTIDDEGNEIVTDKDGHRLKSAKAGQFMGLDEALLKYAEDEKMTQPQGAAVPVKRTVGLAGGPTPKEDAPKKVRQAAY